MNQPEPGFLTAEGINNLSPREAAGWCVKDAVLLDIREEYISQFKKFGVPEMIQIPLSELKGKLGRLRKDAWIIVADSSGLHGREACLMLKEQGFGRVSNLAGGMVEWERDGMPLITDNSERLTGSCACQLRARDKKSAGDVA